MIRKPPQPGTAIAYLMIVILALGTLIVQMTPTAFWSAFWGS